MKIGITTIMKRRTKLRPVIIPSSPIFFPSIAARSDDGLLLIFLRLLCVIEDWVKEFQPDL